MCSNVLNCLKLFQNISKYLNISQHISTYLDISRHISTYLDISRHISTFLDISRHISTYLDLRINYKQKTYKKSLSNLFQISHDNSKDSFFSKIASFGHFYKV